MLDGYRTAATPQDQLRLLYALAEFDDESLILRTCELAMSGEIKTQNAPFVLRMCIGNRRQGAAAWTFVRQHWTEANAMFPSNTIVRMIDSVRTLTDEVVAADVQAFFAEHPIEQAAKTLDQVLERQRVNTALRAASRSASPPRSDPRPLIEGQVADRPIRHLLTPVLAGAVWSAGRRLP